MPKRITIRVPEPCEVDIDVTPVRFTVHGKYLGHAYALEVDMLDAGEWTVEDSTRRFSCRDEATEYAVQKVCARIARYVASARIEAALA